MTEYALNYFTNKFHTFNDDCDEFDKSDELFIDEMMFRTIVQETKGSFVTFSPFLASLFFINEK